MIDLLKPHMTISAYKDNEVIVKRMEKCSELFYVEEGVVLTEYKSITTDIDRTIAILAVAKQVIGLENFFLAKNNPPGSLVSLGESKVYRITFAEAWEVINQIPPENRQELLMYLSKGVCEFARDTRLRMEQLTAHYYKPKESVENELLRMASLLGGKIGRNTEVKVKTRTLAKLTGLTMESTRDALNKLMQDGKLAKGSGCFIFLN